MPGHTTSCPPSPLLCQLAGGGLQLATLPVGKSNFQSPPGGPLWALASSQLSPGLPSAWPHPGPELQLGSAESSGAPWASQLRLEEKQCRGDGGGTEPELGSQRNLCLGSPICLPCPSPACSLASHHPARLAWRWAVRGSERECQCLGSLGAFQSQGLGVSLRGHCRGGVWKAWSGEDIDVWGCEGLPRHGWTWGLGTETQGDPHRAVVPTVLASLGHPVRKQGGKGGLSGMRFEYLEPSTMKILERKFSDRSEANKTKAIIR